jgi:hypothetical protein
MKGSLRIFKQSFPKVNGPEATSVPTTQEYKLHFAGK